MRTEDIVLPRLLVALSLTLILTLSVTLPLQSSSALTKRDFGYLNDQHLTVSNGDTKVCGDHLCAPGEWAKLQESLVTAQQGRQTTGNATQPGIKHDYTAGTASYFSQTSYQISSYQVNPTTLGMPTISPVPIPVPNPTPQTLGQGNQSSAYVTTDKPYYQVGMLQGTIVFIHGQIPNLTYGTLTISVKTPYSVYKTMTTYTDATGLFSIPYIVDAKSLPGTYTITVYYQGGQVVCTFYVMRI